MGAASGAHPEAGDNGARSSEAGMLGWSRSRKTAALPSTKSRASVGSVVRCRQRSKMMTRDMRTVATLASATRMPDMIAIHACPSLKVLVPDFNRTGVPEEARERSCGRLPLLAECLFKIGHAAHKNASLLISAARQSVGPLQADRRFNLSSSIQT